MYYSQTIAYTSPVYCEAYITKGKNRLKQNGQQVYLADSDEFSIELFNPKSNSVLARIKINGAYISSRGLVLKPGQRVFLDRYIDIARAFKFSTYDVDSTDPAVQNAIKDNGLVEIEFYDETVKTIITYPAQSPCWWETNQNPHIFYSYTNDVVGSCSTFTSTGNPTSFAANMDSVLRSATITTTNAKAPKSLETGRVEMGSTSNTKLNDVDMEFSTYISNMVTWQILPESQQPITTSELKKYCTSCGYRQRKDNWAFCPSCGSKL